MRSARCAAGVVIVTRNRGTELRRTLEHLGRLPERPAVVVVDNASTDGSPDLVERRFPGVRLVKLQHNEGAAARNAGAEILCTPLVAFCDDDSWWAPGALDDAAEIFRTHPKVGLLAARVLVGEEERLDPTCNLMTNSPLGQPAGSPGPRILGFIACGAIVRREAFLQAGGFDAHLGIGGEEDLLAMRMAALGWELAYIEDLVAYHHPSPVRDRAARLEIITRNRLWTTWLLRSRREVARSTLSALALAATSSRARHGVVEAFRGLPWVLRQRRRLPQRVEVMAKTLSEAGT